MSSCESFIHVALKNFLGIHSRLPEVLHFAPAELPIGQLGLSGTEVCRSLIGKVQLFLDSTRVRACRFRRLRRTRRV